jgi:catechol 2,3-dioxygenase-like lactoylglutathione lyase family enzyme
MGIVGVHALLYTSEPEAARELLRDVFGWEHVDAGDGWLIFALPPAELGVHPAEHVVRRDLSLMCDDLEATMAELRAKGIEFAGEPEDEGWGIGVTMLLPGGAELLLYEPRHPTAIRTSGR